MYFHEHRSVSFVTVSCKTERKFNKYSLFTQMCCHIYMKKGTQWHSAVCKRQLSLIALVRKQLDCICVLFVKHVMIEAVSTGLTVSHTHIVIPYDTCKQCQYASQRGYHASYFVNNWLRNTSWTLSGFIFVTCINLEWCLYGKAHLV